jgi:hypothetical protein
LVGELDGADLRVRVPLVEVSEEQRLGCRVRTSAENGEGLATDRSQRVARPFASVAGQVADAVGADVVAVRIVDLPWPLADAIDGSGPQTGEIAASVAPFVVSECQVQLFVNTFC